ncbi:MAG TPA: hypothetical protein VI306_13375 [Pyrinomonadaceae bacterium]
MNVRHENIMTPTVRGIGHEIGIDAKRGRNPFEVDCVRGVDPRVEATLGFGP